MGHMVNKICGPLSCLASYETREGSTEMTALDKTLKNKFSRNEEYLEKREREIVGLGAVVKNRLIKKIDFTKI